MRGPQLLSPLAGVAAISLVNALPPRGRTHDASLVRREDGLPEGCQPHAVLRALNGHSEDSLRYCEPFLAGARDAVPSHLADFDDRARRSGCLCFEQMQTTSWMVQRPTRVGLTISVASTTSSPMAVGPGAPMFHFNIMPPSATSTSTSTSTSESETPSPTTTGQSSSSSPPSVSITTVYVTANATSPSSSASSTSSTPADKPPDGPVAGYVSSATSAPTSTNSTSTTSTSKTSTPASVATRMTPSSPSSITPPIPSLLVVTSSTNTSTELSSTTLPSLKPAPPIATLEASTSSAIVSLAPAAYAGHNALAVSSGNATVSGATLSRPGSLLSAAGIDCKDPRTGLDPTCWKLLNLTAYVKDWMRVNGTKKCLGNVPFATCFQRSLNVVGQDCTGIKLGTCTPPVNEYSPEDYYVLYNIYGINQFFTSWWTALNAANGLAAETMAAIVNLISPPKTTQLDVLALVTALAAAMAFVDVPVALGLTAAKAIAAEVLLTAAQQTPTALKSFFPQKTENKATMQISEISHSLADLVLEFQGQMSATVGAVASNATALAIWAETGMFSGELPSMEAQKNTLYQSLNTYVISRAYSANNVVASVALDTDVKQLQANSSGRLAYDIKCAEYDRFGLCNAWWQDRENRAAYALNNLDDMTHNYYDDMQTIFKNNWTTPRQLFADALKCKGTAGYEQRPTMTLDRTSGFGFPCMSTLKVCTWQMGCELDPSCEFSDCNTQKDFASRGCRSMPSDIIAYTVRVPAGYLGDFLTAHNPGSQVCNT
ncbi:MAG: hypothetical protein M1832_006110 [Thelocarpon impressellum]|nr:MAG: hypothetical protein M1832_006110 [Thelocarpon impressellum]